MNGKQVLMTLNGKKLPIALVSFIILTAVGYGEIKNKVETNVKILDPIPQQIAKIEQRVENIDGQFTEFRGDYKADQREIRSDLKDMAKLQMEIYKAVK